ncbi:hypothetical protein CXF96_01580 [Stenotrophomonas sp. Betaine-02u-21]|nr:hypothetical protein CXF90_05160 [Stenotrophomonas sp. Betaine-02u-23]PKH76057.1 hypothetical protein CXF96_01580 [Stenotrophomonas sp. Betaine-02u-21]PKH95945.1 hypothetical protein CXG43_09945 [Stenotrophomonas sp. Bg11-02]
MELVGDDDVFSRLGLERRRQELIAKIDAAPATHFQSQLTFKGSPVVGTYGISAAFGAKAVAAFSDAVSAVGASLRGNLAPRGPVTAREDFDMLITGTAIGSFGFELEGRNPALIEGGNVEDAVSKAIALLEASSVEEDDALAEVAVDLDRRAIVAVRSFADVLAAHGALCTVATERRTFTFNNHLEVLQSVARLSDENIVEADEVLYGALLGVLPVTRSIEFRTEVGEVIRGKVDRSVGDLSDLHQTRMVRSSINVRTTKVGDGKPKYLFLGRPVPVEGGLLREDPEQ